jgi:hypothetical protein
LTFVTSCGIIITPREKKVIIMLYLMMNKSDKELLVKVGFSDRPAKLRQRRLAYRSYNPRAIMRSSCAGNTAEEHNCHCTLSAAGGSRILGTEWFVVSQELFDELYNKGMGYFKPNYQPIHFLEEFSENPLTND